MLNVINPLSEWRLKKPLKINLTQNLKQNSDFCRLWPAKHEYLYDKLFTPLFPLIKRLDWRNATLMIYNGNPSKMTENIRNTLVFLFLFVISCLSLIQIVKQFYQSLGYMFCCIRHMILYCILRYQNCLLSEKCLKIKELTLLCLKCRADRG